MERAGRGLVASRSCGECYLVTAEEPGAPGARGADRGCTARSGYCIGRAVRVRTEHDRKLLRECTRSKRSRQNNLLLLPAPVVCCQCESGDQQISRTVAGTDFPARPSCHRAHGLPPGCFGKIPRRPKTELRHQRRKTWGCWTCRRDKFLSVYEA